MFHWTTSSWKAFQVKSGFSHTPEDGVRSPPADMFVLLLGTELDHLVNANPAMNAPRIQQSIEAAERRTR